MQRKGKRHNAHGSGIITAMVVGQLRTNTSVTVGLGKEDQLDALPSAIPPAGVCSLSSRKRVRLHTEAFHNPDAVGIAAVPRKVRSAMCYKQSWISEKCLNLQSKAEQSRRGCTSKQGKRAKQSMNASDALTDAEKEVINALFALSTTLPCATASDESRHSEEHLQMNPSFEGTLRKDGAEASVSCNSGNIEDSKLRVVKEVEPSDEKQPTHDFSGDISLGNAPQPLNHKDNKVLLSFANRSLEEKDLCTDASLITLNFPLQSNSNDDVVKKSEPSANKKEAPSHCRASPCQFLACSGVLSNHCEVHPNTTPRSDKSHCSKTPDLLPIDTLGRIGSWKKSVIHGYVSHLIQMHQNQSLSKDNMHSSYIATIPNNCSSERGVGEFHGALASAQPAAAIESTSSLRTVDGFCISSESPASLLKIGANPSHSSYLQPKPQYHSVLSYKFQDSPYRTTLQYEPQSTCRSYYSVWAGEENAAKQQQQLLWQMYMLQCRKAPLGAVSSPPSLIPPAMPVQQQFPPASGAQQQLLRLML